MYMTYYFHLNVKKTLTLSVSLVFIWPLSIQILKQKFLKNKQPFKWLCNFYQIFEKISKK